MIPGDSAVEQVITSGLYRRVLSDQMKNSVHHAGPCAFCLTLVPIRPRSRGERRSLRTFPAHLSTHPSLHSIPDLDAFQLRF
jgi:hypothetical protein